MIDPLALDGCFEGGTDRFYGSRSGQLLRTGHVTSCFLANKKRLFASRCHFSHARLLNKIWISIHCLLYRTLHIMFSRKMLPPAFLAQLKSRGGPMHVQNNWLRGWFMVSDCSLNCKFLLFSFICLLSSLCTAEGAENGLEFTIVRPFNWIGPRMDFIPGIDGPSEGVPRVLACFSNVTPFYIMGIHSFWILLHISSGIFNNMHFRSPFLQALLRHEQLKLVDGGQSQRTFIYIKDAIEAVLLMIVG